MQQPRRTSPLLVIVGETASGKSMLAMELARQFDGEIVCADSWTVYRGFDIGTAKASVADRREIQHHLVDIAEPIEGFSAAVFKREAEQAIADIQRRGKLPILTGGTGLYIDSVLYDYGFLDRSDTGRRAEFDAMELADLVQLAIGQGLDMSGIDLRNKRRVIRLIENMGQRPTKQPLRDFTLVLGVHIPRDMLSQKVEQRVDEMVSFGLEREVKDLSEQYGWSAEPMKGIGYREWRAYFDGQQNINETKQKIVRGTLQLAKKQRTWFKRNNSIQWVNDRSEAVDITTTFLNN